MHRTYPYCALPHSPLWLTEVPLLLLSLHTGCFFPLECFFHSLPPSLSLPGYFLLSPKLQARCHLHRKTMPGPLDHVKGSMKDTDHSRFTSQCPAQSLHRVGAQSYLDRTGFGIFSVWSCGRPGRQSRSLCHQGLLESVPCAGRSQVRSPRFKCQICL